MEISYDIGLSVIRWFFGLLIGGFLGLIFFLLELIPVFKKKWYKSSFDFFRAIPIIGLVPLIQMTIGVKEWGKVALIAWGVMFPMWISVRTAYKKDYPNVELMLRGINVDNNNYLKIYVIPRVFGGFVKGIEIGIGIAWLCVVAAEWIGTYSEGFWSGGIGYKLVVESDNTNWLGVLFILFVFGALGVLSSLLWRYIVKSNIINMPMHDFRK